MSISTTLEPFLGRMCEQTMSIPEMYRLSLPANIFFLVVVSLLLQPSIYFTIKYRTFSAGLFLLLGLLSETIAYAARVYSSLDFFNNTARYAAMNTLALGPVFISTGIYLTLPRIIAVFDGDSEGKERIARGRGRVYSFCIVGWTVLMLTIDGAGLGISNKDGYMDINEIGPLLQLAGIVMHLFSQVVFIAICVQMGVRCRGQAKKGSLSQRYTAVYNSKKFKLSLIAWTIATFAIMARTSYRIAILVLGTWRLGMKNLSPGSEVVFKESLFMVMESVMMVVACVLVTAAHPGVALGSVWKDGSMLKGKGKGESLVEEGETGVGEKESEETERMAVFAGA